MSQTPAPSRTPAAPAPPPPTVTEQPTHYLKDGKWEYGVPPEGATTDALFAGRLTVKGETEDEEGLLATLNLENSLGANIASRKMEFAGVAVEGETGQLNLQRFTSRGYVPVRPEDLPIDVLGQYNIREVPGMGRAAFMGDALLMTIPKHLAERVRERAKEIYNRNLRAEVGDVEGRLRQEEGVSRSNDWGFDPGQGSRTQSIGEFLGPEFQAEAERMAADRAMGGVLFNGDPIGQQFLPQDPGMIAEIGAGQARGGKTTFGGFYNSRNPAYPHESPFMRDSSPPGGTPTTTPQEVRP